MAICQCRRRNWYPGRIHGSHNPIVKTLPVNLVRSSINPVRIRRHRRVRTLANQELQSTADSALYRARLVRLHVQLLNCPPSVARDALLVEIASALDLHGKGAVEYARYLYEQNATVVGGLRKRQLFKIISPETTVGIVLLGILVYSAGVLLFLGPCVVVVSSLAAKTSNSFTLTAAAVGLTPLFEAVMRLGIRPEAYLWGLFGGAGAVVSMVRRFEQFPSQGRPVFWLLFAQGLLNPIVGSLSAVVICSFVYHTDQVKIPQAVPTIVLAFFSGFSERLLVRTEALITGLMPEGK